MRIKVDGTWQCRGGGAEEYLDAVASFHPTLDWFAAPSRSSDRVALKSLRSPRATVSIQRLEVRQRGQHGGTIAAIIDCNPTRTLAHLLVAHPDRRSFADEIAALNVGQFFAVVDGVTCGLDGNNNVIADYDGAIDALGPDPFVVFLPIFAGQLQRLLMHLLAPYAGADDATRIDGQDVVMGADDLDSRDAAPVIVRMRWGSAAAPQIETYFERFHATARAIVRAAGQSALAGLDDVTVHRYIDRQSFRRVGDAFTIISPIPNDRELVIYAKLDDRIRFEVRKKKGASRYDTSDATNRFLAMMNSERASLMGVNWESVGRLFDEPDGPHFPDLLALIQHVGDACAGSAVDPQSVVRALLLDGGTQRHRANARPIDQLVRLGVLRRVMLRHRAGPAPHRYSLTADYRAMQERLLTAFVPDDCETA